MNKYYKELLTENRKEFKTVQEYEQNTPNEGNNRITITLEDKDIFSVVTCNAWNYYRWERNAMEWTQAYITLTYKKGCRTACEKYIGISAIATVEGLYGRALKNKIEE